MNKEGNTVELCTLPVNNYYDIDFMCPLFPQLCSRPSFLLFVQKILLKTPILIHNTI